MEINEITPVDNSSISSDLLTVEHEPLLMKVCIFTVQCYA